MRQSPPTNQYTAAESFCINSGEGPGTCPDVYLIGAGLPEFCRQLPDCGARCNDIIQQGNVSVGEGWRHGESLMDVFSAFVGM
jgi:hypothetical protein